MIPEPRLPPTQPVAPPVAAWRMPNWQWALLLVAATVAAYYPALHGEFIWDDFDWTDNIAPLLRDSEGLSRMWTEPTALQQYYPLTGTSFWIDWQLWGRWTLPYHLQNVLLHAGAALLFWRLLEQLGVPGARLAAAIFALHPAMVESVAWITERKNVLSMVFYLGALLAYGRFTYFWMDPPGTRRDWKFYYLGAALFLAALLAKVTTFALPAVILLLAWWKRRRFLWKEDVPPVLPWFLASIEYGRLISWIETHHLGAKGAMWDMSWMERLLVAGRALCFYLGILLWPSGLCPVYERWQLNAASVGQWLFPVAVALLFAALWWWRRSIGRGPAVALYYFAGTLFPVLGFMNVYGMKFSFVGDRWVYLSSLGPIALVAAIVVRAADSWHRSAWVGRFAAVVLPLLWVLTWRQAGSYRDAEIFWRTAIGRNPRPWKAHNDLGVALERTGRLDEAIGHYRKSVEIDPSHDSGYSNLAGGLLQQGKLEEAMVHYRRAIALAPNSKASALGYYNLGNAYLFADDPLQAIAHYREAIYRMPDNADFPNNLGLALLRVGRSGEAVIYFRKSLQLQPRIAPVLYNLGNALLRNGETDEAIAEYREAIEVRPDYAEAHNNLGNALAASGRLDDAALSYRQAAELVPDFELARMNLGNILMQQGRREEAIAEYRAAVAIRPANADAHNNLAVALLQVGQPEEGLAEYRRALESDPEEISALRNLAWVLATHPYRAVRNGAEALRYAEQATELTKAQNPAVLRSLAAALAENGRFTEAVTVVNQALGFSADEKNPVQTEALRAELDTYESKAAFRDATLLPP